MNYQYSSSPQLSEEQKQIAFSFNPLCQLLPAEMSLGGSNQSFEKLSSQRNHLLREDTTAKSARKDKRTSQQLKNVNRGHWSTQQNKKYHWFLQIHYRHFVNRHMRRTDKIFKTMQIFIGTRQAEQCRSHHQKMQKKYLNFISIISNLREIHYSTQDIGQMLLQIESNGIEVVDNLATLGELKAYKKRQDQIDPLPLKKAASTKPPKQPKMAEKGKGVENQVKVEQVENVEQCKQHQNQDHHDPINMFEQSRINIGDILMYHEKEDNSFILFQH